HPALDPGVGAGEHEPAVAFGPHRARDPRRQGGGLPPLQRAAGRALRPHRHAERRRHLFHQRPRDHQPGEGARGLREAQVGQPPLAGPGTQRPESNQGLQHPMRIIKASLVSYLVAATAYGPWAFAQPKIVPVPASPPPTDRPVTAAQAPGGGTTEQTTQPARKKGTNRKWKLAPNTATPTGPSAPAAAPPVAGAPAPAGTTTTSSSGLVEYPGEKEFNSCKKLPSGKAILKLNMKPDTEIGDLIGWLSSITCTPFLIPSTVGIAGKKVTVIAPQAMTPGEAYRLFYAALESVGLTVEPSGRFLRIVDTGRARMTKLPYYGDHDAIPHDKR